MSTFTQKFMLGLAIIIFSLGFENPKDGLVSARRILLLICRPTDLSLYCCRADITGIL